MNVTRRELLGTMPAAMAGAWALSGHGLSARQAGGAGAGLVPARLGVQLYTVRDQLKTLDATLGAIKAAGFDEVETLRPILADLPPLLKKHGLTAPSGHFDAALVLEEVAVHVAEARQHDGQLRAEDARRHLRDLGGGGLGFLAAGPRRRRVPHGDEPT